MTKRFLSLLFALVVSISPVCCSLPCSEAGDLVCPPGLFCVDGHCKCGVYPKHIMKCNGTDSMMLTTYCATFNQNSNMTSVGDCLQISHNINQNEVYQALPRTSQELNKYSCGPYNRTGILCGKCLPDQYPLAYSYDTSCIPCPHARWNWLRYIMAAYIPLTLFYLLIAFFKINITSSHLFSAVFFCQTIAMPVLLRSITVVMLNSTSFSYYTTARVVFSLYGVWNLDFFRLFYSDLCLGIGILPTLALDYAIAVYPLLLTVICYLLISLHDRNFKVVALLFKPFKVLSHQIRRNWDIRTSMVDSFVTFFVLSNVKFLSVSFDFLIPMQVYHLHPNNYSQSQGLFYTAEVEYFSREHLPYGILAIAVLTVFVALPVTVLALYPFSCFQKCLNLFPFRWYILHTFADAFYGCYKDGTEPGTRDCRWFISIFFVLRFLQFFLYFFSVKIMYNLLVIIILILYTALFVVLQPFKSSFFSYNILHIFFLLTLNIFAVMTLGVSISMLLDPQITTFFYVLGVAVCLIPLFYFLGSIIHWLYSRRMFGLNFVQRLRAWRRGYDWLSNEEDQLPDRIDNSGEYHKENLANFSSDQRLPHL